MVPRIPGKAWLGAIRAGRTAHRVLALLYGGVLGLPVVPTELWGGLLVTLVVASVGIAGSFPVGIALALGRRSRMPFARWASVGFIEFVRGVPLITVLFMSSVMLPLFLPAGVSFDKLLRALVGVALFAGAYMAETIRGGLQAIPRGQFEAAEALGLSYPQRMALIILPQALKLVIPGIVNSFVGLFKDTSLVLIIGLFDVLGIVQLNLTDAKWFANTTAMTGYVFAGLVFWIFCFGMSRYSQMIERRPRCGGPALRRSHSVTSRRPRQACGEEKYNRHPIIHEPRMIPASAFSADALLAELLDWVRIESPTYDAAAVDRMEAFIAPRIAALGFASSACPAGTAAATSCAAAAPDAATAGHPDDRACRYGAPCRHPRGKAAHPARGRQVLRPGDLRHEGRHRHRARGLEGGARCKQAPAAHDDHHQPRRGDRQSRPRAP